MLSRLLTRREQAILAGLAASLFVGSASLVYVGRQGDSVPIAGPEAVAAAPSPATVEAAPVNAPPPSSSPPAQPAAPPPELGVAIVGAVAEPGLYYLEPGARVRDLILKAGGLTARAEVHGINADAPLIDATTLEIPTSLTLAKAYNPAPYLHAPPAEAGYAADPAAVAAPVVSGGRININTASQAELESLNGIGPALAQRIIAYRQSRPFTSPDELTLVSGIGEKKLAALRHQITAE